MILDWNKQNQLVIKAFGTLCHLRGLYTVAHMADCGTNSVSLSLRKGRYQGMLVHI